jgi:hypothetical protein
LYREPGREGKSGKKTVVGQFERRIPSAAKAGTENKLAIAAVNRRATQNQEQKRAFPQTVKPRPFKTNSN